MASFFRAASRCDKEITANAPVALYDSGEDEVIYSETNTLSAVSHDGVHPPSLKEMIDATRKTTNAAEMNRVRINAKRDANVAKKVSQQQQAYHERAVQIAERDAALRQRIEEEKKRDINSLPLEERVAVLTADLNATERELAAHMEAAAPNSDASSQLRQRELEMKASALRQQIDEYSVELSNSVVEAPSQAQAPGNTELDVYQRLVAEELRLKKVAYGPGIASLYLDEDANVDLPAPLKRAGIKALVDSGKGKDNAERILHKLQANREGLSNACTKLRQAELSEKETEHKERSVLESERVKALEDTLQRYRIAKEQEAKDQALAAMSQSGQCRRIHPIDVYQRRVAEDMMRDEEVEDDKRVERLSALINRY